MGRVNDHRRGVITGGCSRCDAPPGPTPPSPRRRGNPRGTRCGSTRIDPGGQREQPFGRNRPTREAGRRHLGDRRQQQLALSSGASARGDRGTTIGQGTGSGPAGGGDKAGAGHNNDQEDKLRAAATPMTATPVSNTTGTTVHTSFRKFMSGPLRVQQNRGRRRDRGQCRSSFSCHGGDKRKAPQTAPQPSRRPSMAGVDSGAAGCMSSRVGVRPEQRLR